MPVVFIRKSDKKDKKLVAILPKDKYPDIFKVKTVHFGQKQSQTYLDNNDELKKSAYIARHIKNEDWNDPNTAGFWSKNLLWNKKSLEESGKDIEKRFKIKVRFR